jgi:rhomboid protease GluP
MLATVRNRWKLFPITLMFFVISLGLYVAERTYEFRFPGNASEARRALGAATTLTRIERIDGQLRPIAEFHGPFDIWDGEVWRIVVNTFVHGDLLHLGSNLVGLLFLGYWLETRIRRIDYFLFFMIAGIGSMLIEFLLGNVPVGISGAIYAIFGRLIVMRYYDEELREEFSEPLVGLGIIWLMLCVPLTINGLMPIANAAHFFGFFYGLFVGVLQIETKWKWSRRFAVTTFLAAHALFIPGIYFVAHPVWDGRFQWFRLVIFVLNGRLLSERARNLQEPRVYIAITNIGKRF